jgi:hypothetical protein
MDGTPAFQNHVFISYAHLDNERVIKGQAGWVEEFDRVLKIRLQEFLGEKSNVWRDQKIDGNDILTQTIIEQFPKTAALVSVLSPRYLKSESCLKELREFIRVAELSGGIHSGHKLRLFKVIKTPLPDEEHPMELRDAKGYEFYERDEATDRPREFSSYPGDDSHPTFQSKVYDVAYDISRLIKLIQGTSPKVGSTIYLAETTSDREESRNQIKRELHQRGYAVLPDKPLPLNLKDLENAARENLNASQLSIHPIGTTYGVIPEGAEHSIVRLQVELANARAQHGPFPRVLWLPPRVTEVETRQKEFLTYLRTEVAGQEVDLVEDNMEKVKTFILDKLTAVPKKTEQPARSNGKSRIYLICDKRDLTEVRTVQQHLYQEGFEVILPAMDGDVSLRRKNHEENLVWCDAALIYYASGKDPWFWKNFRDLDQAYGFGRPKTKDWLAKAIYLAPPRTGPKETVLSHEALVIRAYDSFRPELLHPFVVQVKKPR